jgi:hypothetical protein
MTRSAVFLLWMAIASGADNGAGRKEPSKLPAELEPVFGLAMAAPPEFSAAALLRLTPRIPDKALRRNVIAMAFHLAGKARNPVRLVSFPGIDADSRQSYLSSALALKLDALSLQTLAIQQMLGVDPVRARALFAEIVPPRIPDATCEDTLLPDVSPYYEALSAITQGAFSEKERAKSEQVSFATAMLSRVSAIADLAPAARTVAKLELSPQTFQIALGPFISSLESVGPNSRAFLYFSKAIDGAVEMLIARAKQLGVAAEPLAQSYRKSLITQFRGPHCADSGKPAGRIAQMGQSEDLFGPAIRGDQPPIASDEMTPERVEGTMQVDRFWQSGEAQRIYAECLKLRQGPNGVPLTDAARRSREWTRQLTDFLTTLANWRPNDELKESDYFHQKAIVYEALLDLTPPGDLSDSVLQAFIDFLKSSNLQQQNGVEWFWHARSTVSRVRPSHPEQAAKILAAYRSSGNIVLMLEAMLDQVSPLNPYVETGITQ